MRCGSILFWSRMFVPPCFSLFSNILVFVFLPTRPMAINSSYGGDSKAWACSHEIQQRDQTLQNSSLSAVYSLVKDMQIKDRLRSVGFVWRNTNEKEPDFPVCNDKLFGGRKSNRGFQGFWRWTIEERVITAKTVQRLSLNIFGHNLGGWQKC